MKVSIKSEAASKYVALYSGKRVNYCKLYANNKIDLFLAKFVNSYDKYSSTLLNKCPFARVSFD